MFCLSKYINGYKMGRFLGKGSYGNVNEVSNNDGKFALKQIKLITEEDVKKIYREIHILKFLSDSLLSTKLYDGWIDDDNCVYLVLQKYDMDLSLVKRDMVTDDHLKYIAYQIFTALDDLHSAGIIHRDIKPTNVLINAKNCSLAICDYNLSTVLNDENIEKSKTFEVVSKWYQAPELLASQTNYGYGIDIWAAGCVLAELVLEKPIWCNETKKDRLEKIMISLGHDIQHANLFPPELISPHFREFLIYIFCVDPLKRPDANEILNHSFIASLGVARKKRLSKKLYFEDCTDLKKIKLQLETIKKE